MIGSHHKGALLTINDRASSMVWICKLKDKQAIPASQQAIKALEPYKYLLHTITSDNGKEFADHENISKALGIDFYFANPYHSWERGANENMNGLIRQYFPKKSSFKHLTNKQIQNETGGKIFSEEFVSACNYLKKAGY